MGQISELDAPSESFIRYPVGTFTSSVQGPVFAQCTTLCALRDGPTFLSNVEQWSIAV